MTQQPTAEQRLAAIKARQEFHRQHSRPSAEQQWLAYCPDNGLLFFATEAEALEWASSAIENWLDDGWDEQVEGVLVGRATHKATQVDRRDRPADEELDEDGCDADGHYWDPDWSYCCNYKPLPLLPESGDAVQQIMDKVQEFASTWSSVGGPFDSGDMQATAEECKAELRALLEAAL